MQKITDTKLDEIETVEAWYDGPITIDGKTIRHLLQALRACRAQSKAKDAVIPWAREAYSILATCNDASTHDWRVANGLGKTLAALDKEIGDAVD